MALDVFYSVIGFVLAIGVLVVVHEFGHFWVARRLGVKVLRFSVGFGKPLWRKVAGADRTEYVLSALPLGGYVKMLDENEGEVKPEELPRAFNRQRLWKRMAIVLAGPAFNFLFAILAYAILFMIGVDGIKPVVGKVAESSLAAKSGFRAGDEWLRVDDMPVQSWDQHRLYIYRRALDRAEVQVQVRTPTGELQTRTLDLRAVPASEINATLMEQGIGLYGYMPTLEPVIGSVQSGSAAAAAGVQVGDRLLAIDNVAVTSWQQAVEQISGNPGRTLKFRLQRGDTVLEIPLQPRAQVEGEKTVGKIGAGVRLPEIPPEWRVKVRLGPLGALERGAENTWSMSVLTLKMLYKMLLLEVSHENISGPITIAQYAGYSVQIGLDRFLMFLAIVSISLGVLNLLPIPILDGGHLLFYAFEGIKGSPLSERAIGVGQRVGMVVLFGLMMLAFYNDFARILH